MRVLKVKSLRGLQLTQDETREKRSRTREDERPRRKRKKRKKRKKSHKEREEGMKRRNPWEGSSQGRGQEKNCCEVQIDWRGLRGKCKEWECARRMVELKGTCEGWELDWN